MIRNATVRNANVIKRLKNKGEYKVVFFMMAASNWKYDYVYKLMESSTVFKPIVVVIPLRTYGNDLLLKELRDSEDLCQRNGYKYLLPWDQKKKTWKNIKTSLNPDIVFFSSPYAHSHPNYQIKRFLNCLTCYVPYSIRQENNIFNIKFNTLFQNIVTRNYYESRIHHELARKYARNKGENVVVTGFPIIDTIRMASSENASWKKQTTPKRRIIWAPHWTFEGTSLNWSSFLIYCNYMLGLADKYRDTLQFSFKPHPLLRNTLSGSNLWGLEKTNEYFESWQELENGQVDESDYINLFSSSDALIHDCGSFMIEYLALDKPVLYLLNNVDVSERFNEFGRLAFDCHYKARSEQDIETFIQNVVQGNNDPMKPKRREFQKNVLKFNEGYASEKIVNEILSNIGKPTLPTNIEGLSHH